MSEVNNGTEGDQFPSEENQNSQPVINPTASFPDKETTVNDAVDAHSEIVITHHHIALLHNAANIVIRTEHLAQDVWNKFAHMIDKGWVTMREGEVIVTQKGKALIKHLEEQANKFF